MVAVLLVVPAPVSVALTAPVVLLCAPTVTPRTLTLTVQVPLAARAPPLKLSVPAPAVAVTVPLQVLLTFGVAATARPAGSGSLKPTPLRAAAFGLVSVKVSVTVPSTATAAAPNAFWIVGSARTTSVAVLLVVPVPPLVELTAPVVFACDPVLVPVTLTLTTHGVPGATVPPAKLSAGSPAAGLNVALPQPLVLAFGGAATCSPLG